MCSLRIRLFGLLCAVVAVTVADTGARERKNKVVSTVLNAKWPSTHFLMETAEFLAEESEEYFWSWLDFLAEQKHAASKKLTDHDFYELAIAFSSRHLSWTKIKLLRFALSLRHFSPKIEMFHQISADRGVDSASCESVVEFRGQMMCDVPNLEVDGKRDDGPSSAVFNVDHIHPNSNRDREVIFFYADMSSPSFSSMHLKIMDLVNRGLITYVFRHYTKNRPQQKLRMSGYGIELQIKSTEYRAQDDRKISEESETVDATEEDSADRELDGFYFSVLSSLYPEDKEKLSEFKQFLLDQNNDMAPLKGWQLQDLSMQAASRIMNSPSEDRLKVLSDIAQNFPSHARQLSKTSVSKDLKREVKENRDMFLQRMNIQPSDAALFINGLFYDMDYVDVFTLFSAIKSDASVLDGLGRLGLSDVQARKIIAMDFSNDQQTYGIDIRDPSVHWINDIENDDIYQNWPRSVNELLRPTFPGILRSIRKNFFNIVIICNPADRSSRSLIKNLESFYLHRAPTRIGIVFDVNPDPKVSGKEDAGVAILQAFNYISTTKEDPYKAFSFMTGLYSKVADTEDLTVQFIHQYFMDVFGRNVKESDVFGPDSQYDSGRSSANDFIRHSGLKTFPQVLVNGVPISSSSLTSEDFEEALMIALMRDTNFLQKSVYRNVLSDADDCVDFLMKQPHIMPRLNDRILSKDSVYIDINGDVQPTLERSAFTKLNKASQAATLSHHLPYLMKNSDASKMHVLTSWIVADLEKAQGRQLLSASLAHLQSSHHMRLGVIHNNAQPGLISMAVQAVLDTQKGSSAVTFLKKLLKEDTVRVLTRGEKHIQDYDIPGADMDSFNRRLSELKQAADLFFIHQSFASKLPGFQAASRGVVINGRVLGPFDDEEEFSAEDFNLLDKSTMNHYGDKMATLIRTDLSSRAGSSGRDLSELSMKMSAMMTSKQDSKARTDVQFRGDKHSVVVMEPVSPEKLYFEVDAIVDPVSQGAQKISGLLLVLSQVLNVRIRIFLNCVDKHSEMPQKSYYRLVLNPELTFTPSGSLAPGPMCRFTGLPEQPIFTMHYHIPDNWLVEPVKSVYDVDNIQLSAVEGNVHSEYELEYLLLEGHCFEAYTGNPPRGLQLTLGTETRPVLVDTIVMANLGYLQLKSNPGLWNLGLREGRSADIYDIVSHEGTEGASDGAIQVLISSFKSKIIKLKVAKKPDKANEELLETDNDKGNGIWSSIRNTFAGSKSTSDEPQDQTLNIFCLASGHLYERLLKIMMLSVLRTTSAPVKFWILKNFLSPSLKQFLPQYAKRYGFEYEYVQYKWPRWLNQQKEKQRIIWGYKILFLDVLFPLNVKKIIFVDTDQIVRSDLTELRDFDLSGAPYGYTPFCDSNTDMEGFRFWKQGYWKSHLAGRPYHISALYVVDLVRFRQIAAGDRLRGQYQALSQDPNSLANLDQDLPNNMIHQVPIKSLPQEWLWCETWCDKASLKNAKSIDLCNNPLTKESKLDAARRIVSEWTNYDEEMQLLADKIREADDSVQQPDLNRPSASHQQQQHSEL